MAAAEIWFKSQYIHVELRTCINEVDEIERVNRIKGIDF